MKPVEGTVKPIHPNNSPGDVPPQKRLKSHPIAGLKLQEEKSINNSSQVTSGTTLSDSPCETIFNV